MKQTNISNSLRSTYDETLKEAASKRDKKAYFQCDTLLECDDCPFSKNVICSNMNNILKTFDDWQSWWKDITGEIDSRTIEDFKK